MVNKYTFIKIITSLSKLQKLKVKPRAKEDNEKQVYTNELQINQFLITYTSQTMQVNINNPENRAFAGKKIFLVICLYFILTITSRYAHHDLHNTRGVAQKIQKQTAFLEVTDLYQLLQTDQVYTGMWIQKSQSSNVTIGLTQKSGSFQLRLGRTGPFSRSNEVKIELRIVNGDYIDQGTLSLQFIAKNEEFQPKKGGAKSANLQLKGNSTIEAVYVLNKMMITEDEGSIFIKDLDITLQVESEEKVSVKMETTVRDTTLELNIYQKDNRLIKLTMFAVVAFIVSYVPFIGVVSMLRGIYNGSVNPLNLSLCTVTVGTMWDAVVCIIAFKLAFQDQQSLVLFIMPAFMLCLLFSNLEPRLMLAIFQSRQHRGCLSYNMLSYGSLLLIYPVILLTNLNRVFFLLAACILFPQIYLNAVNGVRPEIKSNYYMKFVLSRYLVVIYLKTFPYNVFRIEPDYLLAFVCLLLIIFQLVLLHIQHKFGPKTIVPNCMLEPVFDYSHEEAVNLQEGEETKQCSICLSTLSSDPPGQPEQVGLVPTNHRLMKTPCKHTYHSSCLLSWMKIKMVCPQCRSNLPPFQ